MRVLHFTHTFAPQYGGTTTRLLDLLPLTGDEHYLYVRPPPMQAPPDEDFGKLHVRRRGVKAGLRSSRAGAAFAAQLVDRDMDLVHGHNPPQCAWASLIASRRLGVPLVYEAHRLTFDGVMDQAPGSPWRHPARVGRALVREGVFFYAARAIIVQTVRHRDRVLSLYPGLRSKIHVVPVHVNTDWFDRSRLPESQQALKRKLGFCEDATSA